MDRVYLCPEHLLLLIDDDIRPLGETVGIPEYALLESNLPMRPEIGQDQGMDDTDVVRPCFLAPDRVDTDPDRDCILGSQPPPVLLKTGHLGRTELHPRKRMKRKKGPLPRVLKETECRTVLVL